MTRPPGLPDLHAVVTAKPDAIITLPAGWVLQLIEYVLWLEARK
jgi:hypothetical protein